MAIIPLKQKVTIHRRGEIDDWGEVTNEPPFVLKCRADEITEKVVDSLGNEAVSSVKLLFNKLPDVRESDVFEYTNELGRTIKRKPINIEPYRMLNGKAILTAVHL